MVATLWSDLLDAGQPNHTNRKYFLGPLVELKRGSKSEVVDGQQRLVTLSLLFRAMKDSLEEILNVDNRFVEKTESIKTELDEVKGCIKLHHDADDDVFRNIEKYLKAKGETKRKTRTQENLIDNYSHLYKLSMSLYKTYKLNDPIKHKSGLEKILAIIKNLKKKAMFIIITLPSRNDVYTIFQSLNSKSTPLKQADLIKSHLMAESNESIRPNISIQWKSMLSGIGTQEDKALYESMLSRDSREIQEKRLYETVRTKYKKDKVGDYLKELDTDLKIIKKLNKPKEIPELKLRYVLFCLSKIEARYFRRVVIAAMRKWGDNNKKTINLIDFIVKFFFMYRTICEKDITALRASSRRAAVQIEEGCDLAHVYWTILINDERDDHRERIDQKEFVQKFEEKLSKFSKKIALYTLISLEHHYESNDIQYPMDKLQLEHIFPETPRVEYWSNIEANKNHKQRLGNLTLVTSEWNPTLSNFSFEKKMYGERKPNSKCYENSGLELNKRLARHKKWTPKEMSDREKELLEEVPKIWNMKYYAEKAKKFEK